MRLLISLLSLVLGSLAADAAAAEPRVIALEKQWEIGGLSEAEGEMFGVITDVAVGVDGRVYLVDRQIAEVKVFTGDGGYVRTMGRKGEGPGEFQMPVNVFVMPDGKVGVSDSGRISLFDAGGDYAGRFPDDGSRPGNFQHIGDLQSRAGLLILIGNETVMGDGHMDQITRLVRLGPDAQRLADIASTEVRFEFGANEIHEQDRVPLQWCVGPDGLIYIVRGVDYEIEVRNGDGELVRTITADYEHLPRTREQKQDVVAYFSRGGGTQGLEIDVMDNQRDIEWVDVADSGRVWILSSRGADAADDDSLGTFDVYETNGKLVEQVALRGAGDPHRDRYHMIGNRMFVVTRYADAFRAYQRGFAAADASEDRAIEEEDPLPMSVICYQVP